MAVGLVVLLACFCSRVYSQEYAFRVLATVGENVVKTKNSWELIKTGVELKSNDIIKVKPNAYLALVDKSSYPLELKTAGTYSIKDLSIKNKTKSTVLIKYLKFIVSSNSAEAKLNRSSAIAAVHREMADLNIQLPKSTNYFYSDSIALTWETKIAGPYKVSVRNMFNETLYSTLVNETSLQLDLNPKKLQNDSLFNIEVTGTEIAQKGKVSSRIFKKVSVKKRVELDSMLANLAHHYENNSVFSYLIRASLFEQNGLFADANTEYVKAIKLYQMADLIDFYNEFLWRIKLDSKKRN